MSHVDGIMALRQLFPLILFPHIRTCLSLYYPRLPSVPRISMNPPLSEGFRTTGEVCALYSPAETAIFNGPDVWAYRKWLLSKLPLKNLRKASRIRTVFLGRTRSRTGSGKERKAVWNKGKAASDTDIIRLRRRFGFTSLFFTLAVFLRNLQKFTPSLDKMPIRIVPVKC